MILEVFIVFMALALILILLGFIMDMTILSIVGFLFIFVLNAFVIMPYNLYYVSGSVINSSGALTYVSHVYTAYNDATTHYIVYYLFIMSFLGVILIFLVKRRSD